MSAPGFSDLIIGGTACEPVMSEKEHVRSAIRYLGKAKEELVKVSKSVDLGVEMIEFLAYLADQLSTYQEAIADEAHLDTSKRRSSRIYPQVNRRRTRKSPYVQK